MSAERIEKLETMLRSRTDRDGKPLGGYAINVEKIKAEIARLKDEENGS